jgi:hypothetical protein
MPIPLSTRFVALLVAGAAGIAGASCNKSSDESPRAETASAAAVPAQPVASADTGATAEPQQAEAPQPDSSRAVKPARKKPVVEPAAPAPKPTPPAAKPAPAAPESPAPADASQEKWLSYDAATKTVTFELVAGPFTFNGYRNGEVRW